MTDYNQLSANAAEAALTLLGDAFEAVHALLEHDNKPTPAEAILIIGFAMLAQRDMHFEEMRATTASTGEGGNESERHRQAALDYDWLKWLVNVAMPNPSEAEYSEAQARIQRLAGL